ncbi:hypothetical protein AX774_g5679 [Zancudomyces culisetae]|uniref:Uncharacterized protein n=1 Tax=Zancudomyces culisetae TaxID=1213189 RepID=A0A1R1PIN9_ZANCU|nr:hypothetical protein AX774_g5679 [Zancudomyces culisetae]|eukprot:OMH80875.1 hypothetical protein AX774_g5679 [Zancudomyces culisetae]
MSEKLGLYTASFMFGNLMFYKFDLDSNATQQSSSGNTTRSQKRNTDNNNNNNQVVEIIPYSYHNLISTTQDYSHHGRQQAIINSFIVSSEELRHIHDFDLVDSLIPTNNISDVYYKLGHSSNMVDRQYFELLLTLEQQNTMDFATDPTSTFGNLYNNNSYHDHGASRPIPGNFQKEIQVKNYSINYDYASAWRLSNWDSLPIYHNPVLLARTSIPLPDPKPVLADPSSSSLLPTSQLLLTPQNISNEQYFDKNKKSNNF